jgi:hypothetical protein
MLVMHRERVGHVAFARLCRERLVHDSLGGVALPADIAATPGLRRYLVTPFVPGHAWLTGLAALWVHGFANAPDRLDLATRRGAHRTEPVAGSPPLAFHAGWLAGLPTAAAAPKVATVARACLDALALSPASSALPATASALRAGATTISELRELLSRMDRHTPHKARVASLVAALGTL